MAELIDVANAMFRNRKDWVKISEQDKEKYSFIFNRYFSKMYPHQSIFLNIKNIDKSEIMNLWFEFMRDNPYPNWFWSKSQKNKNSELIDKSDFKLLFEKLNLNKTGDLDYLIEHYYDLIKEELKFYKTKSK
jgi:hypothetical protein